jgi:hypothetical protein
MAQLQAQPPGPAKDIGGAVNEEAVTPRGRSLGERVAIRLLYPTFRPTEESLRAAVAGKVVVVTGASHSIGKASALVHTRMSAPTDFGRIPGLTVDEASDLISHAVTAKPRDVAPWWAVRVQAWSAVHRDHVQRLLERRFHR